MHKHNKLFKSIVAILVAVMMMGTIIPTFALAADEVVDEATTSEQDRVDNTDINTVGNAFDAFIQTIKDFFQRIIDFFKDLFGIEDEPAAPVAVEGITVDKTNVELWVGDTDTVAITVTATVTPDNADNKEVEWKSGNEAIVTVDGNGKITSVGRGKTTVTVTSKENSEIKAEVAVYVKDTAATYVTDLGGKDEEGTFGYICYNTGGTVVLDSDIIIKDKTGFLNDKKILGLKADVTLDLNGYNIIVEPPVEEADVNNPWTLFYIYSGSLTVVGDGNISATNDACIFWAASQSTGTNIYGGNYSNNNQTTGAPGNMAIIYSSGGPVNVYGGTFTFEEEDGDASGFNVQDSNSYANEIVLHEGVLLSLPNYYCGWDAGEIALEEGCELVEVEIDGVTWYQVTKK